MSSCIFNSSGRIAIEIEKYSRPLAKCIVPEWGDKVNSGGVNYIPQSGTMNLATCDNRKIWF